MTSKTQSSAKASKPIEDAVAAGKETIEQAMKASTEGYEQAIAMGKEHVANASNAMFRVSAMAVFIIHEALQQFGDRDQLFVTF